MAEGLSLHYSSNTNIFLKIDGVDGESVAKGHTKEIEVISWSWSGGNPASFDMGTGGSLGRVKLDQLRIVKPVDRSSPILWSFLCRHFYPEKAVLTCLKASGENPLDYLTITLRPCIVTGITVEEKGENRPPEETIHLAFAKVCMTYQQQDNKGKKQPATDFEWSVQERS
jgi:type VI secretion system secreted protein Hcp